MELHPNLAPLAALLGIWNGAGRGEYPTIAPFPYTESVTFGHSGKPVLAYAQRTAHGDDGRPLHAESGFWRVPAPGELEVVIAHPTGHVEVLTGTVAVSESETRIDLASSSVVGTPSAKTVTALARRIRVDTSVDPAILDYELDMAAVGVPLVRHLVARLVRQP